MTLHPYAVQRSTEGQVMVSTSSPPGPRARFPGAHLLAFSRGGKQSLVFGAGQRDGITDARRAPGFAYGPAHGSPLVKAVAMSDSLDDDAIALQMKLHAIIARSNAIMSGQRSLE